MLAFLSFQFNALARTQVLSNATPTWDPSGALPKRAIAGVVVFLKKNRGTHLKSDMHHECPAWVYDVKGGEAGMWADEIASFNTKAITPIRFSPNEEV